MTYRSQLNSIGFGLRRGSSAERSHQRRRFYVRGGAGSFYIFPNVDAVSRYVSVAAAAVTVMLMHAQRST